MERKCKSSCESAMRNPLLEIRHFQHGQPGYSSRSLKIKAVTLTIAAVWPTGQSSGNNISNQQDPMHQAA